MKSIFTSLLIFISIFSYAQCDSVFVKETIYCLDESCREKLSKMSVSTNRQSTYAIQVLSKTYQLPNTPKNDKYLIEILYEYEKYKYVVYMPSLKEAQANLAMVRETYADAFIIKLKKN